MFRKWRINRLRVKLAGVKARACLLQEAAEASKEPVYINSYIDAFAEQIRLQERLLQLESKK